MKALKCSSIHAKRLDSPNAFLLQITAPLAFVLRLLRPRRHCNEVYGRILPLSQNRNPKPKSVCPAQLVMNVTNVVVDAVVDFFVVVCFFVGAVVTVFMLFVVGWLG